MRPYSFPIVALAWLLAASSLLGEASTPLTKLADAAAKGDADAVAKLRQAGPEGLAALMTIHESLIADMRSGKTPLDSPDVADLRQVLDTVAAQRDSYASGLYWYTDFDAAKAEAKRTGRKILSLRLLGKLNEEYSCANSRFFRTVLYANAEVSKELREHYILHWKSVRPAPLMTIDMGDGRRIKRTITGNSIHYMLNAEGHVIDAIPGLYGAKAFLANLDRAQRADGKDLEKWHGTEADRLCREWLQDAVTGGVYGFEPGTKLKMEEFLALKDRAFPRRPGAEVSPNVVDQLISQSRTADSTSSDTENKAKREFVYPTEFDPGKAMVERPILNRIDANPPGAKGSKRQAPPPPDWGVIETPATGTFVLRRSTMSPDAFDPPTVGKSMVERPVLKQMMPPENVRKAEPEVQRTERIVVQQESPVSGSGKVENPASASQWLPPLIEAMTPTLWRYVAALHAKETQLDEASCRFMMAKLPQDGLTPSERETRKASNKETPFARTLKRFHQAVAEDTVRNEYLMHTQIHQWLETPGHTKLSEDVEALNKKVYAELFLTPDYDEWLGLVPEDTYTALEKDGCACDKGAPPMRRK